MDSCIGIVCCMSSAHNGDDCIVCPVWNNREQFSPYDFGEFERRTRELRQRVCDDAPKGEAGSPADPAASAHGHSVSRTTPGTTPASAASAGANSENVPTRLPGASPSERLREVAEAELERGLPAGVADPSHKVDEQAPAGTSTLQPSLSAVPGGAGASVLGVLDEAAPPNLAVWGSEDGVLGLAGHWERGELVADTRGSGGGVALQSTPSKFHQHTQQLDLQMGLTALKQLFL
jgi:hypothetical protein